MTKCERCEKVAALQQRIDYLEDRIEKLLDGGANPKIHFAVDDERTACGMDLFEMWADTTDNIKETTCKVCRAKWKRMKMEWQKEQEKDNNERR